MIKKNDRPKFVAEAIYTNTLEGKRVSDFFLEEASRYCNDEIELAEFDRRLCKHYGISPSQLDLSMQADRTYDLTEKYIR